MTEVRLFVARAVWDSWQKEDTPMRLQHMEVEWSTDRWVRCCDPGTGPSLWAPDQLVKELQAVSREHPKSFIYAYEYRPGGVPDGSRIARFSGEVAKHFTALVEKYFADGPWIPHDLATRRKRFEGLYREVGYPL